MIEVVFWSAVLTIAYTYALFPLLLWVRAKVRPQPIVEGDVTSSVSMVICAYNEAESIRAKLENTLALDYPRGSLQVIVASDGSDDATNSIVEEFADRGVLLLALPRKGKIPTLNAAVGVATGDVLVFSDASNIYAQDAIRRLVRPLADPAVGCVAGDQRYTGGSETGASADGERAYWSVDRKLKEWGSTAGSATSATGAIYAIRRALFRPVPPGVTDDFVISTRAVAAGYRLVFAGEAAAYERVAAKSGVEFRRKVRVITRGLNGLIAVRVLLDPRRYGFYSLQLFTHKFLRRFVGVPILILLPTSLLLWDSGSFYRLCAAAQVAFYGAAICGGLCERAGIRVPKVAGMPFYFCMVNAAALLGFWNVLRGRQIDRWSPRGEIKAERGNAANDPAALRTPGKA